MTKLQTGRRLISMIAASSLLAGCVTKAPQTSVTDIAEELKAQYPALNIQPDSLGKSDAALQLDQPVSLQQSIQILLSRSPQVRLQLANLGIADAQKLQAELIENPHISIGALRPEGGGRWELDTSLSQPLLALFTRPLRAQLAQENLLEAQLKLQAELQTLIAETSRLYFDAVAALQHCDVQHNMLEATKAKQLLALSLFRAGNMSENNFLFYDNELRRMQQQMEKRQARAYEKQLSLLNFIGLESSQRLNLPTRLPALPGEKLNHEQLLSRAKANRLDLKIAQRQQALIAQRQKLIIQQYGWRDISLGINAEREFDGAKNIGPEVELALPIFNRGQGKLAAISAQNLKLEARLLQFELNTDTQIAKALNTMDSARTQLKILQEAMAVAEKRVELSNREVNFMLTSPLELLSIKRQQIELAHELTENLKDYWQARAQLELAIGGALSSAAETQDDHAQHQHKHDQQQPTNHDEHGQHQEHKHD